MIFTIAVDGPVGAGKSSVADQVAQRLHILHLDTGAMYRAFAYQALQEKISLEDGEALSALAQRCLPEVRFEDGAQRTLIAGQDVTGLIRTPEISMAASTISKQPEVRKAMVAQQQALAQKQSMLLDGRDIGTRVLPNATIKIFLTASAEVRAQRRFLELQKKGDPSTYEQVLADVILRDEQDTTRQVDPLRPADDAQIVDSSDLTQEQVVEDILRRVQLKLGRKPDRAEPFTPMYKVAFGLASFLFRTLLPVKVHGQEEAMMDAPYILIANHQHMMDPLIIGWPCCRYHIRFMGKKELAKNPIAKWLFDRLLMITVDRHHTDMGAIRSALKVLREGHVLGIFPEGTRHKEGVMENLESGIAMLALMGKVKLLPAYVSGKPRLFRPIHLYYGKPISLKDIAAKGVNKESCDEVLERIRTTYRQMVAAHQQTVQAG